MAYDFEVNDQGSIVLITPMNENASEWMGENVQTESWQWMGPSLGVDHRCAQALLDGIEEEGFTVGMES